jgi:hypothetical protein
VLLGLECPQTLTWWCFYRGLLGLDTVWHCIALICDLPKMRLLYIEIGTYTTRLEDGVLKSCTIVHVPARRVTSAPIMADIPNHQQSQSANPRKQRNMLPDEILSQLNEEFPCREAQTQQLSTLYSVCYPIAKIESILTINQQHLPSPPLLVAHGLTATGKSSIIQAYLKRSGLPFAIVQSRECITGRHLLERIVAACLDALDTYDRGRIDRRPFARTENLSALAVNLQRLFEGRGKFVLVLDGVDRQREAPPTLLAALARFGELVSTPVSRSRNEV